VFAADASGKISLTFLNNASTLPGHFELDDRQMASPRQKIRAAGKRPIGIFHSHPISEAVPSPSDVQQAPYNTALLICDVCGRTARLWRVVRLGRRKIAVELPFKIDRSRNN